NPAMAIDGGGVAASWNGTTLSFQTSGLTEAMHGVTVTANDLAGNTGTAYFQFNVNTSMPTIVSVTPSNTGLAGQSGIVIAGANFLGATGIQFVGLNAVGF